MSKHDLHLKVIILMQSNSDHSFHFAFCVGFKNVIYQMQLANSE